MAQSTTPPVLKTIYELQVIGKPSAGRIEGVVVFDPVPAIVICADLWAQYQPMDVHRELRKLLACGAIEATTRVECAQIGEWKRPDGRIVTVDRRYRTSNLRDGPAYASAIQEGIYHVGRHGREDCVGWDADGRKQVRHDLDATLWDYVVLVDGRIFLCVDPHNGRGIESYTIQPSGVSLLQAVEAATEKSEAAADGGPGERPEAPATHKHKLLPVWERLRITDSNHGDGVVSLDGKDYRVCSDAALKLLTQLQARKGGTVLGYTLSGLIGDRVDRAYTKLPKPLQRIIGKPARGAKGYRLKN